MYNITLICTHHSEIGKCNSNELHKIIKSIGPDVIFEELPTELFDKIYTGIPFPDEPLEIKCIRRYLKNQKVEHVPVDICFNHNLSTKIEYMFNSFKKYHVFDKLEYEEYSFTKQEGFAYLNSKKCSELFKKKMNLGKNIIEFDINKNLLSRIYKLFNQEQDTREHGMLKNIYNYSKLNQYNQAVFLIGSGHRDSIMEKVTEYDTKETLKLNWKFYQS